MAFPLTGDKSRPAAEWQTIAPEGNMPIVFDAAGQAGTNTIAKKSDPINQAKFGKKLGAVVIVTKENPTAGADIDMYIALGDLPESPWTRVGTNTLITPA